MSDLANEFRKATVAQIDQAFRFGFLHGCEHARREAGNTSGIPSDVVLPEDRGAMEEALQHNRRLWKPRTEEAA